MELAWMFTNVNYPVGDTLHVPRGRKPFWSGNPLRALELTEARQVYRLDVISKNLIIPIWKADAERTLHEFSLWEAKQIKGPDSYILNAITLKELWLQGEATNDDLLEMRQRIWKESRHERKSFITHILLPDGPATARRCQHGDVLDSMLVKLIKEA